MTDTRGPNKRKRRHNNYLAVFFSACGIHFTVFIWFYAMGIGMILVLCLCNQHWDSISMILG